MLRYLLLVMLLCGAARAEAPAEDALVERLAAYHAYTGGHVKRVGEYAAYLAARVKLTSPEIARCRSAGRLHDLGKLEIPIALLDKPGKLTDGEWGVIKQHPGRGVQLASGIDPAILRGIEGHHERWDGKGYPAGMKGAAIPPIARIVSVADVWDAVTTNRSYQAKRSFGEACVILRQAAGSQLDPAYTDAFLADPEALQALFRKLSSTD